MGPFDDDIFGGDFFSNFFSRITGDGDGFYEVSSQSPEGKVTKRKYQRRNQENLLNTVEDKKNFYMIFNLSGKEKKDISVDITDELVENNYGEKVSTGNKVLKIEAGNKTMSFKIPKKLSRKNLNWSFKNGILEVKIGK